VSTTIFGPIVTGVDVENWCLALAKMWMSTYLSEIERNAGIVAGTLQRPRSYARTISFDKWVEDQLPAVMIVSPGIATPPRRFGDGGYMATWMIGLAVLCSAATQEQTHDQARQMVAALRGLFLQKPSLGGHANGIDWLAERYDDRPWDDARSLAAGQAHFTVDVLSVAGDFDGPPTADPPLTPDTEPWPDWPEVETYEIDVEQVPLDTDLTE
jgi:hypothetical protein